MSKPVFKVAPNLRPVANRILCIQIDTERERESGLVMPDTHQEATITCLVVETGEGAFDQNGCRIPLQIMRDEIVLLPNNHEIGRVEYDGQKYIVCFDYQILLRLGYGKEIKDVE